MFQTTSISELDGSGKNLGTILLVEFRSSFRGSRLVFLQSLSDTWDESLVSRIVMQVVRCLFLDEEHPCEGRRNRLFLNTSRIETSLLLIRQG